MDPSGIAVTNQPKHGDYVVVRSAHANPAFPTPHANERWSVVVWGRPQPDDPKLTDLDLAEARAIARVCAASAGCQPWDGSGAFLVALARAPLVYADDARLSFTLSCEMAYAGHLERVVRWRSVSHLTRDGVIRALAAEGFPLAQAEVLVSRASKEPPPAGEDVCEAIAEAAAQ